MLLTLMGNIGMLGGNIPPIIVTPHGGGTKEDHFASEKDDLGERLKRIKEYDDEDWFLLITNWVISQNSN